MSAAASNLVFRLACQPQQYAWGKVGSSSKVAQYAAATPGFQVQQDAPYAELWMGTHPSAPSMVLSNAGDVLQPLSTTLARAPALMGDFVAKAFGGDLPFLFKVLSIEKALSIQAHPDKALAEQVHRTRPDLYKDPNHKPEMAVALTPFEAMSGFRPVQEIAQFLTSVPEFRAVVGDAVAAAFVQAVTEQSPQMQVFLKQLFAALMTAPEAAVRQQLAALVQRLSALSPQRGSLEEVLVRLNSQFPGDVGCFCIFMLNYLQLQPGQAIFLAANLPHAYISGDCIECMATSDNVVRAGLTPKFRDVALLVDMLGYQFGPASSFVLTPTPLNPALPPSPSLSPSKTPTLAHDASRPRRSTTWLYHAPVPEFDVCRTELDMGENSGWFGAVGGPSILIVTSGDGELSFEDENAQGTIQTLHLATGHVYFVAATVAVAFTGGVSSGMCVFRAFCSANMAGQPQTVVMC